MTDSDGSVSSVGLVPANSGECPRPGVTVRFQLQGNPAGPRVLLLQGVGVPGSGWRPQVEGLGDGHSMLTIDNRGVGGSSPCEGPVSVELMALDAGAVLDQLGWNSVHVVGHSLGGVIAQQLALDRPGLIRSLSLLCTFHRGRDGARPTPWTVWMGLRCNCGPRRWRRQAYLAMLWSARGRAEADRDALAERMVGLMGHDPAQSNPAVWRQLQALGRHDASGRLAELGAVPTLVISADEDRIAPVGQGRALAAAIPGARYHEVPGASHGVILEHPFVINRLLREFWAEVEIRRGTAGVPLGQPRWTGL